MKIKKVKVLAITCITMVSILATSIAAFACSKHPEEFYANQAYVNASDVRLRSAPNTSSTILTYLTHTYVDKYYTYTLPEGWAHVHYSSYTGYVAEQYLVGIPN